MARKFYLGILNFKEAKNNLHVYCMKKSYSHLDEKRK